MRWCGLILKIDGYFGPPARLRSTAVLQVDGACQASGRGAGEVGHHPNVVMLGLGAISANAQVPDHPLAGRGRRGHWSLLSAGSMQRAISAGSGLVQWRDPAVDYAKNSDRHAFNTTLGKLL